MGEEDRWKDIMTVGKVGMTLLCNRFVVDKTHRILIFSHSFDELAFSQSPCGGKEKQ